MPHLPNGLCSTEQLSSPLLLTLIKVSSNLENYLPVALGVLSEKQWEGAMNTQIDLQEMACKKIPKGPRGRCHIGYDDGCFRNKRPPVLTTKFMIIIIFE